MSALVRDVAAALHAYVGKLADRSEIPSLLRQAMASGWLRTDMDVARAAPSLMSMAAFPFFAEKVVDRVYTVRIGSHAVDARVAQKLAVFCRCTRAQS